MARTFIKDPDAVLDYKWDWKALTNGTGLDDWLGEGETISSFNVIAPAGITLDSSTLTDSNTSVVAWLSGGSLGRTYTITCQVVTTDDREDDRSIFITVKER